MSRWRITVLYLALAGLPVLAHASDEGEAVYTPMDPETVELFRDVPIQAEGRIKPLDTYARFTLLRMHGKRSMRLTGSDGERLRVSALEWLLVCLFNPSEALDLPTFGVDDSAILEAIGVSPGEKRRDRYSYHDLESGRGRLMSLAQEYAKLEAADRTPRQSQIVSLGQNVALFERLIAGMAYAVQRYEITEESGETVSLPLTGFLPMAAALRAEITSGATNTPARIAAIEAEGNRLRRALPQLEFASRAGFLLAWWTPDHPEAEAWLPASELIGTAVRGGGHAGEALERLAQAELLAATSTNATAFKTAAAAFREDRIAQAKARGEYAKVLLEVQFYQANLFFWSLFAFLLSFLWEACSWLGVARAEPEAKRSSVSRWVMLGGRVLLLGTGTVCLTAGIVTRCIIRGRPPVSTLYETILFITAVAVLTLVVVELLSRRRVAIGLAPVVGVLGMFLANKYEMQEAVDTMPQLQAVLDTNFWLSTHVTCITIGYAAGLLAGVIAHVYLLGQAFGIRRRDTEGYASVGRMVYGVICFGILFSFVGTMLGGVWANYSWGRFWGWDPKENGALMIVLWQLAMLHARLGGTIRDFGFAICAVIGGAIVSFSWWGVNLLGVGLHSYGFTEGIWGALRLFWAIELAVIVIGVGGRLFWKRRPVT